MKDADNLFPGPLDWDALWDEAEQRYRVQTRDGRKVRIWTATALSTDLPVQGEYEYPGDMLGWAHCEWDEQGLCRVHADWDLVPEPRTIRRWVNVGRVDSTYYFVGPFAAEATAKIAQDKTPAPGYLDTIPVEWKE